MLHPGGLGDLVLLERFLDRLQRPPGRARVTLACREDFAQLPSLYRNPPDEILPLPLNPYTRNTPSETLTQLLRPFLKRVADQRPDIVVMAALRPAWLCWLAAAAARPARAVCCAPAPPPRGLLACLLEEFQLPALECEEVEYSAGWHENQRYQALLEALGIAHGEDPSSATEVASGRPEHAPWSLPEELKALSSAQLEAWGLRPGGYLLCFPCGAAGADAKRWPMENYRAVLENAAREDGMDILLVGTAGEEAELREFRASLAVQPRQAALFIGGREELRLLAALCAQARAFLGNDTGPAHLAQAFHRPGVVVFGGGTWPAYRPWAPGAVGVWHPLPCFGCQWDCFLGHGLCVERIPVEAVEDALRQAIMHPDAAPRAQCLDPSPDLDLEMVRDASARYRAAQADRALRFDLLVELEDAAGRRLDKLVEASRAAESLARGEDSLRAALAEASKSLRQSEQERLRLARAMDALRQQSEGWHAQLLAASGEAERLRGELTRLRVEAEGWHEQLLRSHSEADNLRREMASREAASKESLENLLAAHADAAALREQFEELRAAAADWRRQLLASHAEAERLRGETANLRVAAAEAASLSSRLDQLAGRSAREIDSLRRDLEAARIELERLRCESLTAFLKRRMARRHGFTGQGGAGADRNPEG